MRPPAAGIGRKKGIPNKVTANVKAALLEAFDNLGGVPSLVKWGKANPSEFYGLWGRLAPREVNAKVDVALLSPEERRARIAAILSGE